MSVESLLLADLGGGLIALLVIGGIVLVLLMFGVGIYNKLVMLRNRLENSFAQIEVQLKRRYDLIPNLVETAKAYMKHEAGTLEAVIAARNSASNMLAAAATAPNNAEAMKNLGAAEGALASAMKSFNVVVERYPDLKANANMQQLAEELTSTENKVAFARQAFNDAVTEYNTAKQVFPAVVFAGMFGHGADATLLEFADSKEIAVAPKVSF